MPQRLLICSLAGLFLKRFSLLIPILWFRWEILKINRYHRLVYIHLRISSNIPQQCPIDRTLSLIVKSVRIWTISVTNLRQLKTCGCVPFPWITPHVSGHGGQIWAQSGSDWPQMGQIRGLFQIRFNTFWLTEPKCTESDLKKNHGFVPFGANMTHFGPKSAIHDYQSIQVI